MTWLAAAAVFAPKRPALPPIGPGDLLFLTGILMTAVYAVLQARQLRPSQGRPWRAAAWLPLAFMVFVAGRIAYDVARDPTSHNLWPLEIIAAASAGVIYLSLLAGVRLVTLRLRHVNERHTT